MKPLEGIKVVELSTFVAAPTAGRLLADLGAEVIKIEPEKGDSWRNSGVGYRPAKFSKDHNPIFDLYNSGKRLASLNLKDEDGKEALMELLGKADVFLTNNRPASLKKMGLDYESLKDRFPTLIYAVVLGFGEKGPIADAVAFDTTAFWGRNGFLRDMPVKNEGYEPMNPPSSVGDSTTGYLMVGEICAALFNRTRTGKGDYVKATLYHAGAFCMGTMIAQAQGDDGRRLPFRRTDFGVPGGAYRTQDDEWIYLGIGNGAVNIPRYHEIIGRPDLSTDPRYQPPERWKNRDEYYEIFKEAFAQKPIEYWQQKAIEYDVPMTRLNHFEDVTTDEQAWVNGFVEKIEYPNGKTDVMPTTPIEMDTVGVTTTRPVAPVGTDTAAVLRELGYSEEKIAAMLAAGAAFGG